PSRRWLSSPTGPATTANRPFDSDGGSHDRRASAGDVPDIHSLQKGHDDVACAEREARMFHRLLAAAVSGTAPSADPEPAGPKPPAWRRLGRELAALLGEARSWPTLLLALGTVLIAIPVAILLTPGQEVVTLGQHLTVNARSPSLSISGPAQIVQTGNTSLDVPRLHVYGPVRPRLEMGPAVR